MNRAQVNISQAQITVGTYDYPEYNSTNNVITQQMTNIALKFQSNLLVQSSRRALLENGYVWTDYQSNVG